MKKAFVIFFLVVVSFRLSFAQEPSIYRFSGVILDSHSKQSVPFVHFTYLKSKGFTSNEKGLFDVRDTLKTITAKVSSMGYQTQIVTLSANSKQTIYLNSAIENLNEIDLVYVDEEKTLLKKVIKNIPKNYPTTNEVISGYIQEGVFVDSLFQDTIYHGAYDVRFNKLDYSKKSKTGNLLLTQGKATFHKSKDSIPVIFFGALHSVHSSDIVKRRRVPLQVKRINDYELIIKDTLNYDNKKLIKLFFQHDDIRGNLFIDTQSYAVVKGEYWKKGKTSILEKMTGFERRGNYMTVHYGSTWDDKWRLKYIYFLGKYEKRIKGTPREFYLKENFIFRAFTPSKEFLPSTKTINYNVPSIFAKNLVVQSPNSKSESYIKKLKIIKFLSALNHAYSVDAYPFTLQPYSLSLPFLKNPISNVFEKRKSFWALKGIYSYAIDKKWQIDLSYVSILSRRKLAGYSLGISKRVKLDSFEKFSVLLGTETGYRNVFLNPVEHSFSGSLIVQGKTFHRGKVNIYVGQKEWVVSPKISLTGKLSNRISIHIRANYFFPFRVQPAVLIKETKGLFKKSITYPLESKKLLENKFSYGLGIIFN